MHADALDANEPGHVAPAPPIDFKELPRLKQSFLPFADGEKEFTKRNPNSKGKKLNEKLSNRIQKNKNKKWPK